MKTQGIVTDSDTEKELQAWQQARENPVDEEWLPLASQRALKIF